MKTIISLSRHPCHSSRGGCWQRETDKVQKPSLYVWMLLIVMILLLVLPLAGYSKGTGKSNNGSGGGKAVTEDQVSYGDIFGDLIHILRLPETGQPIFAQRWIEMPAELPGYGWGYCAIGVDQNGAEIPFAPYSCDLAPLDPEQVIEVDYFGRLNGSRTQERNLRMHLNEVISNIQQADRLKLDATGRLMLGFECAQDCLWSTIDSPMESLALYTRLLKYGHLATDPKEEDIWWHGDPALLPVYHPALGQEDFDKLIDAGLENLLPEGNCWNNLRFNSTCAKPQDLDYEDFNSSAVFLGAAASKTGWITVDLVQYLNRFLKITKTTDVALSTLNTLPALYLDCYDEATLGDPEDPAEDEVIVDDLVYGDCELITVDPVVNTPPNYAYFTNIQELFMDFGAADYERAYLQTAKANVIQESGPTFWWLSYNTPLIEWVVIPNPGNPADTVNIVNFVGASNDAVRAIEFVHNYEIPANLYCVYAYDTQYCPLD